jgi:peptidoglycan/LPS O-acetylase OafA/YrhL
LDAGVSAFFVLSGFILTYNYPSLPSMPHVLDFWLKRFARLWPVHIVTLALTAAVYPSAYAGGVPAIVANIFMVHAWVPWTDYFFSGNAVSWSISTEFGFYALFPLLIWRFRSTWPLKLACVALIVYVMLLIASQLQDWPSPGPSVFGIVYFNPLARLMEFALGMCAALLWSSLHPLFSRRHVIAWTIVEVLTASVLVLYILQYRDVVWALVVHYGPTSARAWVLHNYLAPVIAISLCVLASGAGLFGMLLSTRPLVYHGKISFSTYMVHLFIIQTLAIYVPSMLLWPVWIKFPTLLGIVFASSALLYHLVEEPGRDGITTYGRRLAARIWRKNLRVHLDTTAAGNPPVPAIQ